MNSVGVGVLGVYCGLRFALEWKDRWGAGRVPPGKIWLPAGRVGLSVGTLLAVGVIVASWLRPASCSAPPGVSGKSPPLTRIEYLPGRLVLPKGNLLFLPALPEPLTTVGRQVLRPLAESGWRAVTLDLPMYDQEAAGQVVAALRGLSGPTLILAEGARARVATRAKQLLGPEQRLPLVFVEPIFFSALGQCDQSHAPGITSGMATIAGDQWEAFKRDGRSGLHAILATCKSSESFNAASGSYRLPMRASPSVGYAAQPVQTAGR